MVDLKRNDTPIRKDFFHLVDQIAEMTLAAKIVHHDEAAALEILPEIFRVPVVQLQVPRLAQISEGIFEELRAIDIDDLIRFRFGVNPADLFKECRECFVTKWVIVMPRNLAHENRI